MTKSLVGDKFDAAKVSEKWISRWEAEGTYLTDERSSSKIKSYVLGMFPYPSGEGLHTGHGRIFTAVDVISRYQRMKGYEVLMPMGWDAFGLPAENAAIKAKKNPMDMVPHNEANFKRQMMMLGLSYDWNRSFSTTDPAYYKWTQWLFLRLYSIKNDKGERLIYRKEVPINWCPFCKTGLANEEVMSDGTHERCGTTVTAKLMPQWNMRITDYADRLLADLDMSWKDEDGVMHKGLDWPEGILAMQRNWIGKKDGVEVEFDLKVSGQPDIHKVKVFTTRLDTIFGVTFLVVSPEVAKNWISIGWKASAEVSKYIEKALSKSEQQRLEEKGEKSGVNSEVTAVNPVTNEEVPVFVADYVLSNVGTGVVMGVPGHDERDHEFAEKFGLPIRFVVENKESSEKGEGHFMAEDGTLVESGEFSGLSSEEAREKLLLVLLENKKGKRVSTYHLRDWVFSRQRYWGEPFPLVYCSKCGDENGVVPLPDDQLPLTLPYLASYEPTETGESPLARANVWVKTVCPSCGGEARRETDTMPNWAGSCWYFLRFTDPKNDKEVWSKKAISDWMPVDWYLGGAEHAVLHLLYARFWTKAFADLGLLDFSEPFLRLRSVGMVLATDGKKMSKSLGNVVNPDTVVAEFGADAVRIYEMFMGPWEQTIAWNPRSLVGCKRLVEKTWEQLTLDVENDWKESDKKLSVELNKLINKVGADIPDLKFNTSIAAWMSFSNMWVKAKTGLSKSDMVKLTKVIAPFAPFLAEEAWEMLGQAGSVHKSVWPESKEIIEDEVTLVIQVDGKIRASMVVSPEAANDEKKATGLALVDERVVKWLGDKKYTVVFVPGRLVNFVVKE